MTQQITFTPRRAKTRARLLDAARAVIAERGAGGMTVEAVCELAGFTRGAFYSNYSSMEDLVNDLVREVGAARIAATHEAAARVREVAPLEVADAARLAMEAFFDFQLQGIDDTLLLAELELFAIRTPGARDAHAAAMTEALATIVDIVESLLEPMGRRLIASRQLTADLICGYFEHVSRLAQATGQRMASDRLVPGFIELMELITAPKES